MANPKTTKGIFPRSGRSLSKAIWLNMLEGQIEDYTHVSTRLHGHPELAVWEARIAECRKQIDAITAVPGEWFGEADLEAAIINIAALNGGGHVVACIRSDDGGRRDEAFTRRYLKSGYTIKLMPEADAARRHQRYIDSLGSFSRAQMLHAAP